MWRTKEVLQLIKQQDTCIIQKLYIWRVWTLALHTLHSNKMSSALLILVCVLVGTACSFPTSNEWVIIKSQLVLISYIFMKYTMSKIMRHSSISFIINYIYTFFFPFDSIQIFLFFSTITLGKYLLSYPYHILWEVFMSVILCYIVFGVGDQYTLVLNFCQLFDVVSLW